jgi:DNA processing protein
LFAAMRTIARDSAEYPDRLLDLSDPPDAIHVAGTIPPLSPSVAIIGSRRASEQGRILAEQTAASLARAGVTIISGGAFGIDIAAHRGAMHGGHPTLVVLPTPIDAPHPTAHIADFEAVLSEGGAWLSEIEGGPVYRGHFLERNRLIAALADSVLVVEAAARSGTRRTIAAARKLGRRVLAIPWSVGDPRGVGCLEALHRGASAVRSAEDVLESIGMRSGTRRRRKPSCSDVITLIDGGAKTADEIARGVGRPLEEVMIELTDLENEGVIAMRRGGRFERLQ